MLAHSLRPVAFVLVDEAKTYSDIQQEPSVQKDTNLIILSATTVTDITYLGTKLKLNILQLTG